MPGIPHWPMEPWPTIPTVPTHKRSCRFAHLPEFVNLAFDDVINVVPQTLAAELGSDTTFHCHHWQHLLTGLSANSDALVLAWRPIVPIRIPTWCWFYVFQSQVMSLANCYGSLTLGTLIFPIASSMPTSLLKTTAPWFSRYCSYRKLTSAT